MKSWHAPVEVKVVAGLLVGLPVAWALLDLIPVLSAGAGLAIYRMPALALILGGVVTTGLVLKHGSARIGGLVVSVVFALLHAFLLLGAELWFNKLFSGLSFAGYGYAFVLLNSMPLKRHLLGAEA
ncbi:hypothetical protein [Amycolatopsis vancoresmycina]|uniref:Integral membrane protein n=1 Tax=Amycolatopsis vancoresmycina DSM 44592 TaxID=1292037 RepID=R1FI50_9PSEU|nr:hypothetical protein [Amycolatopsis vancoresmycina]EOD59273.1 hypothetical protein H480_41855 [Amycolatopsis vancoresmycina DSM 44592]